MPNRYYKLDRQTHAYEPIVYTPRYIARRLAVYAVVGLPVAIGLLWLFFRYYDSPETQALKEKNRRLTEALASQTRLADTLEQKIDSLKAFDRSLYSKILNEVQLDQDSIAAAETTPQPTSTDPSTDLQALRQNMAKAKEKAADMADRSARMSANATDPEAAKKIPSIRPVKTEIISGFGQRINPINGAKKHHTGIDFQAPMGTEVVATANGVVILPRTAEKGRGTYLMIQHADGYQTLYGHLSKIKVYNGQRVRQGEVVALSGNSGLSKGPHLHYEILKNGKPVDPINYFFGDLFGAEYKKFHEKAERMNESMD